MKRMNPNRRAVGDNRSVHCGALRCIAVHSGAWRCIAVHGGVLWCIAVYWGARGVLWYKSVHYGALRCTAVQVAALRCKSVHCGACRCKSVHSGAWRCIAVQVGALGCKSVHGGAVCRNGVKRSLPRIVNNDDSKPRLRTKIVKLQCDNASLRIVNIIVKFREGWLELGRTCVRARKCLRSHDATFVGQNGPTFVG